MARTGRLQGIDRLRAVALVLMVIDHALVAFPAGVVGLAVRVTATRASLPLFCLVAGALLPSSPRWGRLGMVALAGLAATIPGALIGIGQLDVLLILAVVLAVAPLAARNPTPWLVVAILQPVTWHVPWSGYQPGVVLALVLVGRMVGADQLDQLGRRLPSWSAMISRWPLTVYVGHIGMLAAIVAVRW